MNTPRTAATGFFAWMLVATVHAATTEQEIEHLISYLGNSGCTYVRNGMAHDSGEAVEHIRRKYGHYKSKVDSAESFIKYNATKSTMSGQPYTIICPGEPEQASSTWLLEELQRYRSTGE